MDEPTNDKPQEGWEPETEEGWIFDLPPGARARQESRNRDLRDRLLRNIEYARAERGEADPGDPAGLLPDDAGSMPLIHGSSRSDHTAEPVYETDAALSVWDEAAGRSWDPPSTVGTGELPLLRRQAHDTDAGQQHNELAEGPGLRANESEFSDRAESSLQPHLADERSTSLSDRWSGLLGEGQESGSIVEGMRAWVERSKTRNRKTREPLADGPAEEMAVGQSAAPPQPAGHARDERPPVQERPEDAFRPAQIESSDDSDWDPELPSPSWQEEAPPHAVLAGSEIVMESAGELGQTDDDGWSPAPFDDLDDDLEPNVIGSAEPAITAFGFHYQASEQQPTEHQPSEPIARVPSEIETSDGWLVEEPADGDEVDQLAADEADVDELEAEIPTDEDGEAVEPPPDLNEQGTMRRPAASPDDDEWAWRDPREDDNVLVRAFNAHAQAASARELASKGDSEPEHVSSFADILGDDADDLLAEVSDQRSSATHGAEVWGSSYASSLPIEPSFAIVPELTRPPFHDGFGSEPVIADGGIHHRTRGRGLVRSIVETTLLALLVFLAVRASFQNFRVDGTSMSPTLADGEFLLVNKLVYAEVDKGKLAKFVPFFEATEDGKQFVFHGPERGDVIVLRDPRRPHQDLIKRIIGLPGETVEIRDGKVFINDLLLEEPYIQSPWVDTRPKIAIPEGHYYVLGDNRGNSLDSRAPEVGLIPHSLIIGKALLTYWPFERFGLAPNSPGTSGEPVLTASSIREFLPDTAATTR